MSVASSSTAAKRKRADAAESAPGKKAKGDDAAGVEAKSDALVAFEAALALEKEVNTSLKELHRIAESHKDVTYAGYAAA